MRLFARRELAERGGVRVGRGMGDVYHLFHEGVTLCCAGVQVPEQVLNLFLGLGSEVFREFGDLWIEDRIHGVELHVHLYPGALPGEEGIGKLPSGNLAALLAVGVEAEGILILGLGGQEAFFAQPFAKERAHFAFQLGAPGGKRAGRSFPVEPLILRIGQTREDRILAHHGRADVVAAQYYHLFQGIVLLEGLRTVNPLGFGGGLGNRQRCALAGHYCGCSRNKQDSETFFHVHRIVRKYSKNIKFEPPVLRSNGGSHSNLKT